MKTLVVYKSYSGFTAKYAAWIAEDLSATLCPIAKASVSIMSGYDVIIFGGSLHMSGISGVKRFKTFLPSLSEQKVIVFAVGASGPKENIPQEIVAGNFSAEEQEGVRFFYFRGGFNFQRLNLSNKILMLFFRMKLQGKKNKTPEELGMLNAYKVPLDATAKENILPLLKAVRMAAPEFENKNKATYRGNI